MKRRSAVYSFLGICLALLVVGMATGIQAGGKSDPGEWLGAHARTPLLLVVDFCALLILVGMSLFGIALSRTQEQLRQHSDDHSKQLATMMDRTAELARLNDEYAEHIAALEASSNARQAEFDAETRRLTEQAYQALNGQVDAQARQLEAVNLALQYQRAEIRDVRYGFKTLQSNSEPAQIARPAAPERAAISAKEPPASTQEPPELAEEPPTSAEPVALPEADQHVPPDAPAEPEPEETPEPPMLIDHRINDPSTVIVGTVDFDVFAEPISGAVEEPSAKASEAAEHNVAGPPVEAGLEAAENPAETDMEAADPPKEQPATPAVAEPVDRNFTTSADSAAGSPMDQAEGALSSLMVEAQEALSSLRAQVEASAAPPPAAEEPAPAQESRPGKPKRSIRPWHIRF